MASVNLFDLLDEGTEAAEEIAAAKPAVKEAKPAAKAAPAAAPKGEARRGAPLV